MTRIQKEILDALLDKYESSKISKGGTLIHRDVYLTAKDKVLKPLNDINAIDDYIHELSGLENQSFISVSRNRSDKIERVILDLDHLDDIYASVGRENPLVVCQEIKETLASLSYTGFLEDFRCYCLNYMDEKYRVPNYFRNSKEVTDLLRILSAMSKQDEEIMERDFSIQVLGDSKTFSGYIKTVCRIIRDFNSECPYENDDEILAYYNIVKNSSSVIVKNNLRFRINNQIIDLNDLGFEFSLTDAMLKSMEILDSDFTKIITIENLTTFRRYQDNDAVIIYLAGFNDHTKQAFLKALYQKYPDRRYFHFSDIDCGGFWIFNHLCESTGIPFRPLHMSIEELQKKNVILKDLTDNDEKRLRSMLDDPRMSLFSDVIRYMLACHKKLEQEALD